MALIPLSAQSAFNQSESELALRWHVYAALKRHENEFPQEVPAAFIEERKAAYARFLEALV